ncbi:Phage protein [plant metagenome]|uniref:Phage protein n=1 Tax=plant metagenome TaxID=1297885 RepID=A0A484T6D8_9ZZZZ
MTEPDDVATLTPAETFQGLPVLADRPDETEDLTARWQRLGSVLDNETGRIQTSDSAGQAFTVQAHRWIAAGREAQARLRAFFYALRGRQGLVWVPTYAADLELAAPVAAGDQTLDVRGVGYAEFEAWKRPGRRQIRMDTRFGPLLRAVTGAERTDDGHEQLTVAPAFDQALTIRDVRRVSFLSVCRLDQDAVEFRHLTDSDGHMDCAAQFRATLAPAYLLTEADKPLQLEDQTNLTLEEIWI